jgi:hypothetical protein
MLSGNSVAAMMTFTPMTLNRSEKGLTMIDRKIGKKVKIDIVPVGEEHEDGVGCHCKPEVEYGADRVIYKHRSYDRRELREEIVEQINNIPEN